MMGKARINILLIKFLFVKSNLLKNISRIQKSKKWQKSILQNTKLTLYTIWYIIVYEEIRL